MTYQGRHFEVGAGLRKKIMTDNRCLVPPRTVAGSPLGCRLVGDRDSKGSVVILTEDD